MADTLNPDHASAFNDTTVRREMDDLLQRGNVAASDPKQRHEEVALVRRNPDGSYSVTPVPFTIINHCSSDLNTGLALDSNVVAVIHNHISREGEIAGCPGNETYKYDPLTQEGGSWDDYGNKAWINYYRTIADLPPVAFFIIDPERAYYLPAWSTQGSGEFKHMRRNTLNPGNCRWR